MSYSDTGPFPKVLTLYLELSQYPVMASRIRENMREVLFERGIITQEAFEVEAREKAIQSQRREGLTDPMVEEPPDVWAMRLSIVRDNLTDFYFAYNLPHELFEDIVRSTLSDRLSSQQVVLTFHPELAPWDMLFSQGEAYEALPAPERSRVEHDLREIKVVLTKAMISDHLKYLGIAKEWLDIADLKAVRARRLGRGKIGGKAAGIMLAEAVLRKSASPEFLEHMKIPSSWFIGADVFYQFTQLNGLLGYANQKYRSPEEIKSTFPTIQGGFKGGTFPEDIVEGLRHVLEVVGRTPLIVRSSSLLEDSFGTSFAGKYDSYFLPNQGEQNENLEGLLAAIASVYASVYSPEVLFYRKRMGLIDYDERMAILIQVVQGRQTGEFFYPDAAGVAFSRNQFRWSPRIDRTAGFLRMVWGLGTRAVETVGGDYPRLVALSHPDLRPESDPAEIRRYSQRSIDLIDLASNAFRTLPIEDVVSSDLPTLSLVAQRFHDGEVLDLLGRPVGLDPNEAVITFNRLLRNTSFPSLMREMLSKLEQAYQMPVDTEYAVIIHPGEAPNKPNLEICLLQCRPQSRLVGEAVQLPKGIPAERRLFVVQRLVPEGRVPDVRYVVYVVPKSYRALRGGQPRQAVARMIGRINHALEGQAFILMGPGRWGSSNSELGVPVKYSDIFNARALVEMFEGSGTPEPSYGTHFFQDLVEAHIFPLAIAIDDMATEFNRAYFEHSPNVLTSIVPDADAWAATIRVIDVSAGPGSPSLELVLDGEAERALAYLKPLAAPKAPRSEREPKPNVSGSSKTSATS